jgi:hypothetical protein
MLNSIIIDLGGGFRRRKETLKSNNRIQHTSESTYCFIKDSRVRKTVMSMGLVLIHLCKVMWHGLIITWFDNIRFVWYKVWQNQDMLGLGKRIGPS